MRIWIYIALAALLSVCPAWAHCIFYEDHIHWVGGVDTPDGGSRVAVAGDYAYVADDDSGLQVIDITDPTFPMIIGSVDTPGSACDVAVVGTFAYVADGESGLQVIDITDPASPQLLGGVEVPDYASDVATAGTFVYVADYDSGLQIAPTQCATRPQVWNGGRARSAVLMHSSPNPCATETMVSVVLPKSSTVRLRIYGPAGRLVRTVFEGSLTSGNHALHWDGRDDEGRKLPAGVYLTRIATDEGTTSGRVILMR
jgi:hypothetical protein